MRRSIAAATLCFAIALAGCSSNSGGGGGGSAGAAGGGSTGSPVTGTAQLLAGAAAFDITPGTGAPLAGFGGDPRRKITAASIPLHLLAFGGSCFDPDPSDAVTLFEPAQGVHDPVMARALVIESGGRRFAIVKLDMIGINRKVRDDLAAYAQTLGIQSADLLLAATHTHSGPGANTQMMLWQLIAVDCFHQATYQILLDGTKAALQQAVAQLQPAEIGIDSGTETRVSRNRRNRAGIFDPELGLIKVTTPGGAPIAAVMNFAVHGTALGASNMLFSADIMGYAERELEARLGGGVALYLNGAEGDVTPHARGFSGAQQSGTYLAETAEAVWQQTPTSPRLTMDASLEYVQMPQPVFNSGCFPIPGTSQDICSFLPGFSTAVPLSPDWLPRELPFQAMRFGDDIIATVPGEPITEVGWAIKTAGQALGYRKVYVAGLTNDYMGYVATFNQYLAGQYEAQSTVYGPHTDQIVTDAAERQMRAVR
jgi:hypothetical protein